MRPRRRPAARLPRRRQSTGSAPGGSAGAVLRPCRRHRPCRRLPATPPRSPGRAPAARQCRQPFARRARRLQGSSPRRNGRALRDHRRWRRRCRPRQHRPHPALSACPDRQSRMPCRYRLASESDRPVPDRNQRGPPTTSTAGMQARRQAPRLVGLHSLSRTVSPSSPPLRLPCPQRNHKMPAGNTLEPIRFPLSACLTCASVHDGASQRKYFRLKLFPGRRESGSGGTAAITTICHPDARRGPQGLDAGGPEGRLQ